MTDQTWQDLPILQRAVIEACFRVGADFLWRGPSELLVAQAGGERVANELGRTGHQIIGMDGFELLPDGVLQRLDLIYDPGLSGNAESALSVVARWPVESWIEFVLAGDG